MQKKIFLTLFILLVFPDYLLPQTQVNITRPRLSLSKNSLTIEYDILNWQPADLFKIWIEVTDSRGNIIKPVSITGDCGENITGGLNRKMTWDLMQDKVFIEQEIYVEVLAEKIKIPEAKKESRPTDNPSSSEIKYISKGNVIMSSMIIPGWGQSKVKERKPYWLMGLTAYGCLTGSLILNQLGISTYNEYLASVDIDERNSLFNKSLKQDNFSEYLIYAAAGIWTINFIWALATPPSSKGKMVYNKFDKIRINGGFDPYSKSTIMILSYRF